MFPEIIYEDDLLLALNKPAGLLVHPVAGKESGDTLAGWVVSKYPHVKEVGDDPVLRPGIVHRLDKETSGVILVAKTREMFDYLKRQFQEHAVEKTYLAVVHGVPREREGLIDAPIGIKAKTVKRSIHSPKMAKTAVTAYRVVKTFGVEKEKYSLIEARPKTGRTHQIRIHLASLGTPIVGDPLYGRKGDTAKLMLHAQAIAFKLPEGGVLRLEADPPEEFNETIDNLAR